MKKLLSLLALFAVILTSCTGDPGPPGRDGLDGLDAPLPAVYEETANFNYNADGNVWTSQEFGYNGVLDGDIIIVYLNLGGSIWTNLPVSYFDDQGEFQYVYDFDYASGTALLSIIGDSDLSTIDDSYTAGVPIRIAIIPSDLIAQFDKTPSFSELMTTLDIEESEIQLRK
ncbi:hypothetical protein [Leeuwenhoekiella parthenopeia]|uniref:Dihydrolipoamide dehydrogenase n=1 Tax=Leeuwenhoekiella parthenopeia TaxID=2890320 RepID=A0ABS8GTB6_9FLAO|nr:hypothetical protein [Leeuwenhoekiella parthenopeia]MCC4213240.1 hypothetical protein [Leeuwenhoekiella parthenopeia]